MGNLFFPPVSAANILLELFHTVPNQAGADEGEGKEGTCVPV